VEKGEKKKRRESGTRFGLRREKKGGGVAGKGWGLSYFRKEPQRGNCQCSGKRRNNIPALRAALKKRWICAKQSTPVSWRKKKEIP